MVVVKMPVAVTVLDLEAAHLFALGRAACPLGVAPQVPRLPRQSGIAEMPAHSGMRSYRHGWTMKPCLPAGAARSLACSDLGSRGAPQRWAPLADMIAEKASNLGIDGGDIVKIYKVRA